VNELIEKVPPPQWYQDFIAELKLHVCFKMVEAHHYRGKRINEEAEKLDSLYGKHFVEQLAQDLDTGISTIKYERQFAKEYPELANGVGEFTWRYICNNLLPRNVHFLSGSPEWCTPQIIIDKVLHLFGTIDLDPCSDNPFQPNVPALNHFTKDDDALNQEWFGKVYMNPPYGREISKWTDKLQQEYEHERVGEGIALIPARPDTEWFDALYKYLRCFIWRRLHFSNQENSAPFPSMIIYMGNNTDGFKNTFNDIGRLYKSIS